MARRSKRKKKKLDLGAKKEFTYRGLSVDEMKEMTVDDFIAYLPARKRRSLQRGMTREQHNLLQRAKNADDGDVIRTHLRDMVVLPPFFDREFAVHNGTEFVRVKIQPEMVGHYLGEFAMTRKEVEHTGPGLGATRSSKFLPLK